jgi:hypothetical protein
MHIRRPTTSPDTAIQTAINKLVKADKQKHRGER